MPHSVPISHTHTHTHTPHSSFSSPPPSSTLASFFTGRFPSGWKMNVVGAAIAHGNLSRIVRAKTLTRWAGVGRVLGGVGREVEEESNMRRMGRREVGGYL